MREPKSDTSIAALIARPSERMSGAEVYEVKKALLSAVGMLGEVDLYEAAAALGKSDPVAAHSLLVDQGFDPAFEPAFPMVRIGLMTWLAARMDAVSETRNLGAEVLTESAAGCPADRAREAAFREAPGRFLPDASRSAVRLIHAPGFGMIRLGGVDMPWTYSAQGMVRPAYSELWRVVEDGGYASGILVGPASAAAELALPDGYRFVAVEIGQGGRAA